VRVVPPVDARTARPPEMASQEIAGRRVVQQPGDDCGASLVERLRVWLIQGSLLVMAMLRQLRAPTRYITALLVIAYVAAQLFQTLSFPAESTWARGSVGRGVLLALAAAAALGFVVISTAYAGMLRRMTQTRHLDEVARGIIDLLVLETSLETSEVSVHVWAVRGPVGLRHLELRSLVMQMDRPLTPIVWSKGKGVVGRAWAAKTTVFADLAAIWTAAATRDAFCKLSSEYRLRLNWLEFVATRHYRAVLANPLFRPTLGGMRVVGCLSVESLVDGKADELWEFATSPEFGGLRRVCEAILNEEAAY
jgi:hypothetical protein